MDIEAPWNLAAIISVDRQHRVQCQCRGCGHAVFARVHLIVGQAEEIECWGSTCYERELGVMAEQLGIKPAYTSSGGRRLTDEERALLTQNREALIERFRLGRV